MDGQPGTMTLMEAFGFDQEDLIANRRGWLSDAQQQRLRSVLLGFYLSAGLVVLVALGAVGGLIYIVFQGRADSSITPVVACVLTIIPVVLYLLWEGSLREMMTPHIHHIRGAGRCWMAEDGKCYLQIEDVRFQIETKHADAVTQAIADGVQYHVYYIRLLSFAFLLTIEWVADPLVQ